MKIKALTVVCAAALALGGCTTDGFGTKQTVGTGLGAIAGGLAGSQIGKGDGRLIAVGAGTLLGAFMGSEIGKSLDHADQMHAQRATEQAYAAPIGQTVTWNNPDSGHYGSITPVREGTHNESGQYCREYQQTIVINGKAETAYGTACRQADGSWQLLN